MTLKNAILTIGRWGYSRPTPCAYCEDECIDGSESVGVCQWCEERMCEEHRYKAGMCMRCSTR